MFVLCSFMSVNAQSYLPYDQAVQVLDAELQAWEDGTVDINTINLNTPATDATVIRASKTGSNLNEVAFTGILLYARNEIKAAMDTQAGINTIVTRFTTQTGNNAQQAIDYVTGLVTN